MRRFAERAEELTVSAEPKKPVSAWKYYIIADMKTWSQNESLRSELEQYDTLDAAIARFNELRGEAYNNETVYSESDPELPLARLTLGVQNDVGHMAFDLIQVRGGQNYLNADFTRYEQAREDAELQDTITAISEWCGIDSVLDFREENGHFVAVTTPYAEWTNQSNTSERNYVLVLNDNNRQIQFSEAFDTVEAAQQ